MSHLKKYGLILPDKSKLQPTFQAKRNVFGDDSGSEDESKKKPVLLRPSDNINRQAKLAQEKAVKDDPTVYQYDEVYDSLINQKEEIKIKGKEDKQPKYIENLLKTANRRKIENEKRIERQIQKEREKEGDEFADKEVFVTSAYKKKLEELKLEEEKEKREAYLESIGDVTKQSDLGGFYRHLYEQKLGSTKTANIVNTNEEEQKKSPDSFKNKKQADPIKRNYRKRKSSSENKSHLSEGEIEDTDDEINRMNLKDIQAKRSKQTEENIDADSDFSIDESSDEDDKKEKKLEIEVTAKNEIHSDTKEDSKTVTTSSNEKTDVLKDLTPPLVPEVKPKIDLWKKRTVGEIFEQAVQRYYERKAARRQ